MEPLASQFGCSLAADLLYCIYLLEAYVQTLNGIDSKFRLAILVARRAKQLVNGARRKVEVKSENPLTVALEEFRQGKINFDVLNEEDNLFAQQLQAVGENGESVAQEGEAASATDLGAEETGEEEDEEEGES